MGLNNVVPGWMLNQIIDNNTEAAQMISDFANETADWYGVDEEAATAIAVSVIEAIDKIHIKAGEPKQRFGIWAGLLGGKFNEAS